MTFLKSPAKEKFLFVLWKAELSMFCCRFLMELNAQLISFHCNREHIVSWVCFSNSCGECLWGESDVAVKRTIDENSSLITSLLKHYITAAMTWGVSGNSASCEANILSRAISSNGFYHVVHFIYCIWCNSHSHCCKHYWEIAHWVLLWKSIGLQ